MNYDFSPLLRSAIGFDHFAHLANCALGSAKKNVSYPPYNIEKTGQSEYVVTMALAGFAPQDVSVTHEEDVLIIRGAGAVNTDTSTLMYRGIAMRSFEKRFALGPYSEVSGAQLANGLLTIKIKQILPQERRVKIIPLSTGDEKNSLLPLPY
ncbi:heat shock protein Hsp20 [Neokomagataea thailandica NBRC 106555]|uniref:Heat-shock protein n=2 Tax=Neokomagataea TaxID=1223423 RepID=A0A4Y6V6I7_9PROT|nr:MULTISPECIES: Hsp20 family protein [Neokomagataea]QDH25679.1 heat-shock protein [Neokomagataea tanensis]GBR55287.1 heat shock protein Hsp20 [Neokomagataea thailandica NBRC 106555]